MVDAPPDWAWGSWVLGDLADALRRASDLVGHGTEVIGAQVMPPATPEDLTEVTIVVSDEAELSRLRKQLESATCPVVWLEEEPGNGWVAEILGLHLIVMIEAGELR
jgi:hypothetical protein